MSRSPLILAMGVCHRDAGVAALWLRWVSFLSQQPTGSMNVDMLVVLAKSVSGEQESELRVAAGRHRVHAPKAVFVRCADEMENAYPKSASHLFLRTLETAEKLFPGSPVLWNEPDCWPLRPGWFTEIETAYVQCGKPFYGAKVGTQFPHLAGNSCYPSNWRELAPSIARVLEAPDFRLWGPGKGQPWDVYCRGETTPQMAVSKLWHHVWKERDARPTLLKDIPATAAMFHQDKTGAVIRELAAREYPEFMASLPTSRRFFVMNGNSSRLRARGFRIKFSQEKWGVGGWRSGVCSDELSAEDASALTALVGQFGVREVDEAEYRAFTGLAKIAVKAATKVFPLNKVPKPEVTHSGVYVMLGRYGDICNMLPMLKAEADAGRRPTLVVAQAFADILDGVSYVDRIVWDGDYDRLPDALRWLRKDKGIPAPIVCQYHRNPLDKGRLTRSYQSECWRLAGKLDDFAKRGPLVFDQRDPVRETALISRLRMAGALPTKPLVLVGLESHSSPLANANAILLAIVHRFGDTHEVVNLSNVKAERIYDLIALFDSAALLIAADTVFLHLARASKVPLVAILNDGWRGSVVEHAKASIRYANAEPHKIVTGACEVISWDPPAEEITVFGGRNAGKTFVQHAMAVKHASEGGTVHVDTKRTMLYHAVDVFGKGERFEKAQATWEAAYLDGMLPCHFKGERNAKAELSDPRALPFLKDVLWAAIPADSRDRGGDIVVWSNSDIGFAPGFVECVREHVSKHHAAAMRRTESNGQGHPGRDVFAFTVDWLHEHWDEIPDYVLGAPVFDLGLVAMIRKFHGLPPLTMKLLDEDCPPADMPSYALHESHEPEWRTSNFEAAPSALHNKRIFQQWAKKYAPDVKFTKGGNLK